MKKNKYSTPLWMLATILAGMLSPMQSAVNGQLGHWLQDGNACAVIGFAPIFPDICYHLTHYKP
ncbi:DMT family transporter, partial [Escherichia coli]|nr:DMT family transporter [Escherichia coli]